eukprot:3527085-Alexandrium_andersonii.AAC.1
MPRSSAVPRAGPGPAGPEGGETLRRAPAEFRPPRPPPLGITHAPALAFAVHRVGRLSLASCQAII